MTDRSIRSFSALLVPLAFAACASAPVSSAPAPLPASAPPPVTVRTDSAGIAKARTDSMRLPYTEADVHFMTSMIGHHAQAIEMSRMAPRHGANAAVERLAERIINAQIDEIVIMQQWLADRRKPFPRPEFHDMDSAGHADHRMDGHAEHHMMPGMLTEAQMKQLAAAKGGEFDRLFLVYMIQHHRGAVSMVKTLFATTGAGQDETVFKFASDVNVDQSTEIARMERMLAAMQP